tara:strand:+ start:153100 stop:154131 length:1032 start_codon:yes stop_codon:yes gene_type:complete
MNIGTIYYLVPDIFKSKFSLRWYLREVRRGRGIAFLKSCVRNHKKAIGGIKIFYQHVKYLRELGYDAHVLALGSFDGNVYYPDITAKKVRDVGFALNANDIVVATEFCPYDGLKFSNCLKVVFVQSWIYINEKKHDNDKDKSYRELGFDYVISCSEYISKLIEELNFEDCVTVQNGVDTKVFYPEPNLREVNRILCLPRKNRDDIERIREIVSERVPQANFVEVDGVSESVIAKEYRRADIFLATGYPEGFGLPSIEAIQSGCVVVGFHGQGGAEFLINEDTALISKDGDYEGAAENMIKVLNDPELKERIRQCSQAIVKKYTCDAMKQRIGDFYQDVDRDME